MTDRTNERNVDIIGVSCWLLSVYWLKLERHQTQTGNVEPKIYNDHILLDQWMNKCMTEWVKFASRTEKADKMPVYRTVRKTWN